MSESTPTPAPVDRPHRSSSNAATAAGSLIAGCIKFFGSSAVIALLGWLLWWAHAVWSVGPSVFSEQIAFVAGPTIQVDTAHPLALQSYLDIYLHTKAFDENGNALTNVPADAQKRLGFWVHFQFVPDDFGTIEVRYFFAERTLKTSTALSTLLREETPVLVDNVFALKGRQSAEYFFVQKPPVISSGEVIYLVFYQLGKVTSTGPQKQLLAVISTPIDTGQ
ncbi:MAG TPA: hypothetical protein VGF98_10940 [Candidatus Tumulicola sp.]|jgi:hypothetical protein